MRTYISRCVHGGSVCNNDGKHYRLSVYLVNSPKFTPPPSAGAVIYQAAQSVIDIDCLFISLHDIAFSRAFSHTISSSLSTCQEGHLAFSRDRNFFSMGNFPRQKKSRASREDKPKRSSFEPRLSQSKAEHIKSRHLPFWYLRERCIYTALPSHPSPSPNSHPVASRSSRSISGAHTQRASFPALSISLNPGKDVTVTGITASNLENDNQVVLSFAFSGPSLLHTYSVSRTRAPVASIIVVTTGAGSSVGTKSKALSFRKKTNAIKTPT